MKYEKYTDDQYVPLSDLAVKDNTVINKVNEYRSEYLEVISIDGIDFAHLVDTPSLLKKRYSKNVDIKEYVYDKFDANDYILQIALALIRKEEIKWINIENIDKLIGKFEKNKKDLTIITNYLVNNIDKWLNLNNVDALEKTIPELSKKDLKFIKKHNNEGSSYTLSDYQKANNCVYETARKSLERMTNMKLFLKQKISKKYIYRPTSKLVELMKGSK